MHHRAASRKKRKANQAKPHTPDFHTRIRRMVGFTESREKLMALLQQIETIENDLLDFRRKVNQPTLPDKTDETLLTSQIRELEDQRFRLLSQLYGNRIQHYRH